VFVRVYSALVKRCTQHFVSFDFGIQVILGNNGYIWITKHQAMIDQKKQKVTPFMSTEEKKSVEVIEGKDRENICRVRNAILALQHQFLPIYPKTIQDVIESAREMDAKSMLSPDVIPLITISAARRVQKQLEEEDMDLLIT
jgi:exosome complex component RRP4